MGSGAIPADMSFGAHCVFRFRFQIPNTPRVRQDRMVVSPENVVCDSGIGAPKVPEQG